MKLLLFDIDGTLIHGNGAGREVMTAALHEVFGTAGPIETYKFGGKTDWQIITDLLSAAGFSQDIIAAQLPAVYQLMIEKGQHHFPRRGMKSCPGVLELLEILKQLPAVTVGLLTGNIAGTAPLKLAAAGIEPTQFRLGAFGSDARDRNELPAIAMRRASDLTGLAFSGENTIIVGDTPADILCARAGRATAVAVATGWTDAATLAQNRPDYLLNDLSNANEFIDILLKQPHIREKQ